MNTENKTEYERLNDEDQKDQGWEQEQLEKQERLDYLTRT